MTPKPEVWVVVTTCPEREVADELATLLVAEGLAACAQVGAPVVSRYVWQGKTCCEREIPLTLKVCGDRLDRCLERLRTVHPYTVPELLAWPCPVADAAYRDWVCASASPETGNGPPVPEDGS